MYRNNITTLINHNNMTKYGSFKERKSVNITYHTKKPNIRAYQHNRKNASQDSRPIHYFKNSQIGNKLP